MDLSQMEGLIRKIDQRTQEIEQILPGYSTREDLRAAVAPLATKDEVRAAFALVPTREEMKAAFALVPTRDEMKAAFALVPTREEVREEGEHTRRHFDVVAERMHDDIRLIAEGHVDLDRRVTRLERTRRGPSSPR